jgi:hypothetical protein
VGSVTIAHLPDRDAAYAMVRRDPLVVARLFPSSRSTAGGSAAGPRASWLVSESSSGDKWAAWVLSLSHANDGEQKRRSLEFLVPIRD